MAFSRCLSLAALFTGVESFRYRRSESGAKLIAGIPVHNYELAYSGEPISAAGEKPNEGNWVIVVKPSTTDAQIQSLCASSKQSCKIAGHPQGGVPFVELRGSEEKLEEILLKSEDLAEYIEPAVPMSVIPDIEGQVTTQAASWGLDRIGADSRPTTGKGVNVYVVDTGVRFSHTDFDGRATAAIDVTSGSVVECQDNSCAGDKVGHGTHCAGTVGGSTFGVAPEAKILAAKVIKDYEYSDSSWSYAALDWIATQAAKPAVVSMSLGTSAVISAFKTSVDAAVGAGITVVVAAGNFNADACNYSPAYVPSAITVGATTQSDVRAEFSNFGTCTNIWAPGEGITSLGYFDDVNSRVLSGTSMAAPHVSGAAALLLEADPDMDAKVVRETLLDRAVSGGITDLKSGDTDKLLWVGEGAAPKPTPPSCPSWSRGPDADGDCRCKSGRCYQAGAYGCVWSRGRMSSSYHLVTCHDCVCRR